MLAGRPIAMAFAAFVALCAAMPGRVIFASAKDLRIASEGARPPYNYLDANGELMGFEIDLGRELCRRIAATCVFEQLDWDSLVPALLDKRVDAVMAALEINEDRRRTIDFTKPYVRMPLAFVADQARLPNDASPETLRGKSIGIEANDAHQTFIEERYPESGLRSYATLEEAVLDLAEGRLDAVFGDKEQLFDFLQARRDARCCRIFADVPRDPAIFGEGLGIGLRKQDQALKAELDRALEQTIADGAFAAIRRKYFAYEVR